jgi:hypothetical protein
MHRTVENDQFVRTERSFDGSARTKCAFARKKRTFRAVTERPHSALSTQDSRESNSGPIQSSGLSVQ